MTDATQTLFDHVPPTLRESADEAVWCLKGAWFNLTAPLRIVPACRLGWHRWCSCCSPVSCVRCGAQGHD